MGKNNTFFGCEKLTSVIIPVGVTKINSNAFAECISLQTVYYIGTASDWAGITIGTVNETLTSATIYYYSETQPTTSGNYWHYVDDVPTPW